MPQNSTRSPGAIRSGTRLPAAASTSARVGFRFLGMSGYDPFTGVFELTASKVHRWLRRDTADVGGDTTMECAANLLAHEGLDVLFVSESYLLIRARPGAIWTAL